MFTKTIKLQFISLSRISYAQVCQDNFENSAFALNKKDESNYEEVNDIR